MDSRKEYMDALKQADMDLQKATESTEQLIDMHFTDFAKFLEGKNIGELRAYRVLMQMQLDRADLNGKKLVDSIGITMKPNKDTLVKMGSVFGIVSKIIDRMGYLDYLIMKNSIK